MRDCEFLINNSVVLELSLKLKQRAPLPLPSTGAASGTPGLRPRRALLYRAPLFLPVTYSRLRRYSLLQALGMPTARSREAALRSSRGSRARSLPLEPRPGRAGEAGQAGAAQPPGAPERGPPACRAGIAGPGKCGKSQRMATWGAHWWPSAWERPQGEVL